MKKIKQQLKAKQLNDERHGMHEEEESKKTKVGLVATPRSEAKICFKKAIKMTFT